MTELHGWRLLPYHRGASDFHFALANELLQNIVVPSLWWHSADRPTVIVGAGQRWEPSPGAPISSPEIDIVRRRAGGTAVYATPDVLGLDVALPARHQLAISDIVEAYRWLGEVWVRATQMLGVASRLISVSEARESALETGPNTQVVRAACFGSLSPYEVAVGQRKLVGLAQVRRRSGVLLQSALHLHFDADALGALLGGNDCERVACALRQTALGLDEAAVGSWGQTDVMEAVHEALRQLHGVFLEPADWPVEELLRAEKEVAAAR